MFIQFNPNPLNKHVGDCTVRAICKLLDKDWDTVFCDITAKAFVLKDMASSNAVWGRYLRTCGWTRHIIPDSCPDCYTVREFCYDHPHGRYLLATGTHVVTVIDGDYYDDWDSGDKVPLYFYDKE